MGKLRSSLAVASVFVLVACGSSSTAARHSPSPSAAVSAASPSPLPSGGGGTTPADFPSPAPGVTTAVPPVAFSCTAPPAASEHLALVNLRGVTGIVVRDITDIAHPATRCRFSGGGYFRFYNATHVSYIVMSSGDLGAAGALYLANLATGTTSLVRAWTDGGYSSWVYNWSPDGTMLTYLSSNTAGVQWHLLSKAGDKLLSSLGTVPPRGANLDNDDSFVGFSADGSYVAVETTFTIGKGGPTSSAPPVQVNRTSDGSLAYSRTDGTMAAWAGAGATFYFRTASGVQSWSPTGGVAGVIPSAQWIHPMASPDGSRIAFSLLNAQGNHVANVVDLTSGAVHQMSPNPRVGAAFLTASLVWYAGETICTTTTPCGLGGPPLSGTTYIEDLGSDVETGSIDTAFYDSWPHVVGQS